MLNFTQCSINSAQEYMFEYLFVDIESVVRNCQQVETTTIALTQHTTNSYPFLSILISSNQLYAHTYPFDSNFPKKILLQWWWSQGVSVG